MLREIATVGFCARPMLDTNGQVHAQCALQRLERIVTLYPMPILSRYSRVRKLRFFIARIPRDARVLEVGCGSGWLRTYMRRGGWTGYCGVSLEPPADIIGDIRNAPALGLASESFDVIIAFEVVEHVDCWRVLLDLLKPGGCLMVTTPIPSRDWICRLLERMRLSQARVSAHSCLVDLLAVPGFEIAELRRVAGLAQWGILRKPQTNPLEKQS